MDSEKSLKQEQRSFFSDALEFFQRKNPDQRVKVSLIVLVSN